jgi:hypothetical protein
MLCAARQSLLLALQHRERSHLCGAGDDCHAVCAADADDGSHRLLMLKLMIVTRCCNTSSTTMSLTPTDPTMTKTMLTTTMTKTTRRRRTKTTTTTTILAACGTTGDADDPRDGVSVDGCGGERRCDCGCDLCCHVGFDCDS